MDSNVLTAAISASAAVVTATVALIVNYRGFAILDSRISDINTNLGRRIDDQNTRIDSMAQDIREIRADQKQFFQIQADLDKRLARIEDKLSIPPH